MIRLRVFIIFIVLFTCTISSAQNNDLELIYRDVLSFSGITDLEVIDNYAVVTTGQTGLARVDLNDPHNMELELQDISLDNAIYRRVEVLDGLVFSLIDDNPAIVCKSLDEEGNLELESIFQLEEVENSSYTDITVTEGVCAVLQESQEPVGFTIYFIDYSNLEQPELVSEITFEERMAWQILLHENLFALISISAAYQNGAIQFYDYEDLQNVTLFSELEWHENMGGTYRIQIQDELVYIQWDENELRIYDISDPTNPDSLTAHQIFPDDFTFMLAGDRMYSLGFAYEGIIRDVFPNTSISIYDISDPYDPVRLGSYLDESGQGIYDAKLMGDYLVARTYEELMIFDVSIPRDIEQVGGSVGNSRRPGLNRSCVTSTSEYSFATDQFGGLLICDLTSGDLPELVTEYEIDRISDIVVKEDLLFTSGYRSMSVVDVSDPADPQTLFQNEMETSCLTVVDTILYCCLRGVDIPYSTSLLSYNISSPDEPVLLDSIFLASTRNNYYPAKDIVFYNDHLLISLWIDDGHGDSPGPIILVVDATNPRDLRSEEINCVEPSPFNAIYVRDDKLIGVGGSQGYIYDISNLDSIRLINSWDIGEHRQATSFLYENLLFIGGDALLVYDISDYDDPQLISEMWLPFPVNDVSVSDGFLHTVQRYTYDVYQFNDPRGVAKEYLNGLPTTLILNPAYPNPFNSTTTIEYALPYATEVTLNLYNLAGRRVETLVNGRMQAGVHRTMLDAGEMASGLYFLKLEGDGKSVTQKIMLVK
jgi:hypothetical protein